MSTFDLYHRLLAYHMRSVNKCKKSRCTHTSMSRTRLQMAT